MKVNIELYKGKKLANEENPIVIRIYNKGNNTYKSIGISTKEKYWNKLKRRITCRDKDYKTKNEIIYREYNRILDRINYFLQNREEIDSKYILGNDDIKDYGLEKVEFDKRNFVEIMKRKLLCYGNDKTRENYTTFYNLFIKMNGDYVDTRTINQEFVINYRKKIDEYYKEHNDQKNHALSFFKVSYEHGVNNKWISDPHMFTIEKFKYTVNEERFITYEMITAIINCYKKSIHGDINFDAFRGLYLFVLDIAFQGLAPCDLASIKVGQLEYKTAYEIDVNIAKYQNNEEYKNYIDKNQRSRRIIKIKLQRAKNGNDVTICTDYSVIAPIIDYLVKDKENDDYLIDCYRKGERKSHKQLGNRRGNYFSKLSEHLNNRLERYCEDNNLNKMPYMTFYYARHGFCNAVDKLDVKHDVIRKMVGHSFKTLEESYLNKPTEWEQSLIIKKLFDSESTKIEDTVNYIYTRTSGLSITERWEIITKKI